MYRSGTPRLQSDPAEFSGIVADEPIRFYAELISDVYIIG